MKKKSNTGECVSRNRLIMKATVLSESQPFPTLYMYREFLFVYVTVYLNVSLLVYSGLRDPEWQIGPITYKYREISSGLIQARGYGDVFSYTCIPPKSGYKGFLVQDKAGIHLIVGSATVSLQLALFDTMTSNLSPKGDFRKRIRSVIESGFVKEECQARRKRNAPVYNPLKWNVNFHTLTCNNCYNYATDLLKNNYAQPGYPKWLPLNALSVRGAAESDGLVFAEAKVPFRFPQVGKNEHLVALFVAEGKQ